MKKKLKSFFAAFLSIAMLTGAVTNYPPEVKAKGVTGLKGVNHTGVFLKENQEIKFNSTKGKNFQTTFQNYITVDGTKLMDGKNELKFVSLNYPQATSDTKWEQTNAIKTIKTMGGNVTRSYTIPVYNGNNKGRAYVTGVDSNGKLTFNEDALNQLDQLLAICNEYGVRLIIPLVDHWHWVGGIDGYVGLATGKTLDPSSFNSESWKFYSDETCMNYFKQMIEHLMNRTNTVSGMKYKEDPAIICWETGNEIGAYNQEDYDEALFHWTNTVVNEIKANGAKQLVLDGRMSMTDRSLSQDNKADILGCHYYTGHYPTKTKTDTNAAHRAGKPFILGEFGGYTAAADCQAVFEAALEAETNGTMMWSLRAHKDGYGYYFHQEDPGNWAAYHWPGFPSGEYYDETNIVRTIYIYAQIANGKADNYETARQIPIPAPESSKTGGEDPLLYDITTVGDIKWRGIVGGGWYEIQRADGIVTDPKTANWTTIADKENYVYDSGRNWEDKNNDCIAGFHDVTAITGDAYSYRLRACNESGTGEWSNIVTTKDVVHEIYDDIQMIGVSSNDANPTEIRNVYSYDHSANITTSGGTLQNLSNTPGYIGYTEGIPIKDVTVTTTSVPEAGNEPKLYVSKDDITYTQVNLTGNSGKEYTANNISKDEKIYYARIYVNGDNTCVLDSVKIRYTYTGSGDLNTSPLAASKNVMIQDNTFGEGGTAPIYVRKSDNLTRNKIGEITGLVQTDREMASLIYKTGDDITAYRVTTYLKSESDLDVEISMDGINYSKVEPAKENKSGGEYTKYIFSNVDVSESYRVLRITYPAGESRAILESVEISSGSKRLPMTDASPGNVIEDGEHYFGSNKNLSRAYTINVNKGFCEKDLSGVNFEEYDALYAWIRNDNSGNTLVFRFKDAKDNVWTVRHTLSGLHSGIEKFDFEDFVCENPNAVMDRSSIKSFSMGIELKMGSIHNLSMELDRENLYTGNYGIGLKYTTDIEERSIYVDNIYVSSLTKVDDYESYNGASSLLQAAYSRNTGGGTFHMALDVDHKSQGSYGLKVDYNYDGNGYAGATKSIDYLNLKDFDGIMVYYESDGSGNSLTLQIKGSDGLTWESIGYMDAKGPTVLYMPFESFKAPEWDVREGSFDKNQNITEFSIYTNQGGSITSGILYFDDIKGANFIDSLENKAGITVDTPDNTIVTSLPYEITGTAEYVDYINLQIGDRKRNVPVNADGTWSFQVTKEDKIYNGNDLELSARILYHNGTVIKEDTGKKINIAVEGNDKPTETAYETAWHYNFSKGLENWIVDGFGVSDGVAYKFEDDNFLTWSNDGYSGTLSYNLEVPNGIYTLGNDIRVKQGMNTARMALKSGDTEVKSANLNTEDTMVKDQRLGQNIEVKNGQIQIVYYVDAPSGGLVFAVNNVTLYKVGESQGSKEENYVNNGEFNDLAEDWPNLPKGWDTEYTGGDGWSPIKGDKGEFVGYADNSYTFKLSQDIKEIPQGLYQLKADIKLNNGTVNSVSMGAITLDGIDLGTDVLDKLDTESYKTVTLDNIAIKDGKVTIYITGEIGTKGLAVDNVKFIRVGDISSSGEEPPNPGEGENNPNPGEGENNSNPGGGENNPGSGNGNSGSIIQGENNNDKETNAPTKEITLTPKGISVINKKQLNVNVKIDPDEIIKAAKGNTKENPLKVTIVIPDQISQKGEKFNKTQITVIIPKPISDSENIEMSQLILKKETLAAARKNKISLNILLKDEKGKLQYSWTFSEDKLAASKNELRNMNLFIEKVPVTEDEQLKKIVKADQNNSTGLSLSFRYGDKYPAAGSIKIYVGDQFKAGQTVYAYAYNEDLDKYDSLSKTKYKVDKNGYVTIVIYQGSKYVLTKKAASTNVVTTLTAQTVVPKMKNMKAGKSSNLIITLPDGVSKWKAKILYKTSNKAVVTVSKNGKITGKKKGTATITTTVTIGSNKKAFRTKITVK